MKFRKNNKKLLIVFGASTLALGTIGFASWVINETVIINTQNVDVTFGEVQDTSVIATLDSTNSDFKLAFDALKDNSGKIKATEDKEDLSFHFKYTIKVGTNIKLTGVKFDITSPFAQLVTDGYIKASFADKQTLTLEEPPEGTYTTDNFTQYTKGDVTGKPQSHVVTFDSETNTYTFVSTFTFAWGERFNGLNPSKADNESSNPDQIVENLNAFKAAYGTTTGQQVSVTITPATTDK